MELHLVERFADRELAEATARQMTTCGPKRVERMTFFTRLSCLLKRGRNYLRSYVGSCRCPEALYRT